MTDTPELEPTRWTIEPHGDGYAIYYGRDNLHHGLNVGHVGEIDPSLFPAFIDHVKFRRPTPSPSADAGDREALRGAIQALREVQRNLGRLAPVKFKEDPKFCEAQSEVAYYAAENWLYKNGYLRRGKDGLEECEPDHALASRLQVDARPSAWIKGHVSHTDTCMEYDEEVVAGRDPPPGDGWHPLYSRPESAQVDARDAERLAARIESLRNYLQLIADKSQSAGSRRQAALALEADDAALASGANP